MFTLHDYAKEIKLTSGKDLWDVCRSCDLVRYGIPDGWQQLLPRVRMEVKDVVSNQRVVSEKLWFVESWWRSDENGALGYYVKINLETGMVKEFRELAGDTVVSDLRDFAVEEAYLQKCADTVNDIFSEKEEADVLDILWQAAVPRELRDLALQKQPEQNIGSYLLPLESLTCWNWEKLKELLLKRYDTTVEDILDYLEYQHSESEELYIAPRHREEARKQGLRFWRDGHDV